MIKKNGWGKYLVIAFVLAFLLQCAGMIMPEPASAADGTQSLTITKYYSDHTTPLGDEKTVDYDWMKNNLPVLGDGETHYYHQGPVFLDDPDEDTEQALRWNPGEDMNLKDMGALKGTNVKDLCDLVGGMEEGNTLQIKADDGFKKTFAYENVYEYSASDGPMVICWFNNDHYTGPDFTDGMRLIWFTDDAVFGNYDWYLAADSDYWYYWWNGSEKYPTTSGLSVQRVSELNIFTDEPAPITPPSLTADADGNEVGEAVDITFTPDAAWETAVSGITVNGSDLDSGQYEVSSGSINITADVFATAGDYTVTVSADGYQDVSVIQTMTAAPGGADTPEAAFTADATNGTAPLTVQFTDQSTGTPTSWEWDFNNDGIVDSTVQNPSYEYSTAGTYSVKLTVTNSVGSDDEVKTDYITVNEASAMEVLYDGTVTLTPGETFNITAYFINTDGTSYTVSKTTPLGALEAAAEAAGFTYQVTDKNYASSGALLLDNVGTYLRKAPGYWYAYVNDEYKDGYENALGALNLIELKTGDRVEFYYAAGISDTDKDDVDVVQAAATAAVKTVVAVTPAMDVLYDGTVTLTPDETFTVTAKSGSTYTVSQTTPLGALHAATVAKGLSYGITDKKYAESGIFLLDDVGSYPYVKNGSQWYAYVDGVYKDGYAKVADALNMIQLETGNRVEFYYAAGITAPDNLDAVKAAATAAVKTVVNTGAAPTDWTLQLSGAKNASVTKADFESALASHQVSWKDSDENTWGGIPLWMLVAMVDDDPDVGSDHFNDDLAAQNYEVNVIAGDGWKATLDSAAIARNNGYIVANTLNGKELPLETEAGKGCWPLFLKGSEVFGGQQVGNIVKIELSGMPEPPAGWTLEMVGEIGDTITQAEFEEALACTGSGHQVSWTDSNDDTWSGVPLWVLLGAVDDIETGGHWTFNDALAAGYSVKVSAADFSKTFAGVNVAGSNDYIVANKCNGAVLAESGPLRLVGNGVSTDGSLNSDSVGSIVKIEIPELQTPPAAPGSWNLNLNGKISDIISQAEFEAALACPNSGHQVSWTDSEGKVWSGMPLWFLTGWVDDRQPHDYNANQATAGYTVLVKAADTYNKDFSSTDIAWSNDYIVANKYDGKPLTDPWPLRLVGNGVSTDGVLNGYSVGNIAEIELTSFGAAQPIPEVHIIKYGDDQTTVLDEMTVDYLWMQSNLDVIGDGTIIYRYEAITNNSADVWDAGETYPGGYKIENAVKGTRIRDLCDLVGGMGAGTEIVLTAIDGYETRLPYSSIYTDPSVQARQGDAILAWWADGKYVPAYADGMRILFTPDDHIYGQWDMHETLPSNYWHYYYENSIQYPSCAGLAGKYITQIEIYSVPEGDWTLELDGQDIGGLSYNVSKTYLEQALACQFGANHKATYTDSKNREWEGIPLWFLVGFVDDADQHSNDAFNDQLAMNGYQVVITAADGTFVTLNSTDIIRSSNYIVANSLGGQTLPDDYWPLRLVGPAVSGSTSISKITRIELVPLGRPQYQVTAAEDSVYDTGATNDGITTMTVKSDQNGLKYFMVNITSIVSHEGMETVVFTHLRNGNQMGINATRADFDEVQTAQAGFNVKAGDVIKVYIVDELTNAKDVNPIVLQ